MINSKDQEDLFTLIAKYLEKNITCIAIGGTAMMFSKYKTTTKDIDLIFKTINERNVFIKAIELLEYKQKSLIKVYDKKRVNHPKKPLMFSRGDERFDLFVDNVFGFKVAFDQNNITQRHDFIDKNELIVYILPKEDLILLKAITKREKDFEDIETILALEKKIDWKYIVDKAIEQREYNNWILIDLEETMQKLKEKYFLKQELFDKIYQAEKNKNSI